MTRSKVKVTNLESWKSFSAIYSGSWQLTMDASTRVQYLYLIGPDFFDICSSCCVTWPWSWNSAWGRGTLFPPLFLPCPFTFSFFALHYFSPFPFLIHFTYFLITLVSPGLPRVIVFKSPFPFFLSTISYCRSCLGCGIAIAHLHS